MSRIIFEPDVPVTPTDLARTDVACFVGLVRRRVRVPPQPLPKPKVDWLREHGWIDGPIARDVSSLFDVPMPIENFAAFQSLYDDGHSPASTGTDYLALAVQSFFAQGGKRCYVVRMGDPIGAETGRDAIVKQLLASESSEQDQRSWHGIAHLWGLPDASFLLLPDLPLLHAPSVAVAPGVTEDVSRGPEQFVRCVPPAEETKDTRVYSLPAPRFDLNAYDAWGGTLKTIVGRLSTGVLREVQFVAALPMPLDTESLPSALAKVFPETRADGGISASSAFVQLAYPWLRTTRSQIVLEGLEAPDGTLAGMLARNALVRGTFTSATKIPPVDLVDLVPDLPTEETQVPEQKPTWTGEETARPLVVRVSLFGFTPAGIRLLSDVTTFPGESYRPAPVNRLVSVISRAARHFGETHVFESNGPRLWGALERTIRNLLTKLWSLGAFEGATPAEAFNVRCSRDTMTQNDIDLGRIIGVVSFQAAASIELITVTLTVQAGAATDAEIAAQMVGPI